MESADISGRLDVQQLRYAQVWEDADVLLEGLDVKPGHVCLSIASAGDNALALLTRDPARVVAVDISPAQLACLELRVAGYRTLTHAGLLELIGSRPSSRRRDLYARCRSALSYDARGFWDARPRAIDDGVGSAGKFERYFTLFRARLLPIIHGHGTVASLLTPRDRQARERFYGDEWDTWRWRALFRVFFSRRVMGRFGRDPELFRFVDRRIGDELLARTRHALTVLDPTRNPYVHWILRGTHGDALPCALRAEHFDTIRQRLDRLEWRRQSLEACLGDAGPGAFDRYNLSDAFEYVSRDHYHAVLDLLVRSGRRGARLAYWNLFAPRSRPDSMASRLAPQRELATRLHAADRTFFYSAFVLEDVQ